MSDFNVEQPFLDQQDDVSDWDEPVGPPRKDLVYHGDVRRLLEIRAELLRLQQDLSDFGERGELPDEPLFPVDDDTT